MILTRSLHKYRRNCVPTVRCGRPSAESEAASGRRRRLGNVGPSSVARIDVYRSGRQSEGPRECDRRRSESHSRGPSLWSPSWIHIDPSLTNDSLLGRLRGKPGRQRSNTPHHFHADSATKAGRSITPRRRWFATSAKAPLETSRQDLSLRDRERRSQRSSRSRRLAHGLEPGRRRAGEAIPTARAPHSRPHHRPHQTPTSTLTAGLGRLRT